MALSIKVYGNADSFPSIEEIIDFLEESEFEITIETEDDDEDDWEELYVFESSLDCAIDVVRCDEDEEIEEEVKNLLESMNGSTTEEAAVIRQTLENRAIVMGIELPEEAEDDDNALVMCSLLAQYLAQRCDGIYCVDGEGFFDETGELILELADVE